jgi:hypothetical protein
MDTAHLNALEFILTLPCLALNTLPQTSRPELPTGSGYILSLAAPNDDGVIFGK